MFAEIRLTTLMELFPTIAAEELPKEPLHLRFVAKLYADRMRVYYLDGADQTGTQPTALKNKKNHHPKLATEKEKIC